MGSTSQHKLHLSGQGNDVLPVVNSNQDCSTWKINRVLITKKRRSNFAFLISGGNNEF